MKRNQKTRRDNRNRAIAIENEVRRRVAENKTLAVLDMAAVALPSLLKVASALCLSKDQRDFDDGK